MLFEQPGGQFGGESQDALFALVEGDELFLLVIVEEEVEGGVGVGEPLLPQLFTTRRGSGCVLVHGGVRKGGSGDCFPPDRIPAGSERNYRTAPPPGEAWASRAHPLAQWTAARLVNRTDCWGGYRPPSEIGREFTRRDGTTGKLAPQTTRKG